MRNSSSDKFSFNRKEEKKNTNHAYKKKHKKIDISKPKLFIFYSKLRNYLHIIRGISFFLIKKYKRCQIRKLKKVALNSFSIKNNI